MSWLVGDLDLLTPVPTVLAHTEFLPSKEKTNLTWRNPPAHHTGTQLRVPANPYSAAGVPGRLFIDRLARASFCKAVTCSPERREIRRSPKVSFNKSVAGIRAVRGHVAPSCWNRSSLDIMIVQLRNEKLVILALYRSPLTVTSCGLHRF
ncbi:hypothetical protein TNCV_4860821 [Trichonephila clavipes]|nr:hypothetical protein TNCV_4860821 [Trichonephila clavipes]